MMLQILKRPAAATGNTQTIGEGSTPGFDELIPQEDKFKGLVHDWVTKEGDAQVGLFSFVNQL